MERRPRICKKLSEKTGKTYRLPSEAEWEYACRAGGSYEYCGEENVQSVGWSNENSGKQTQTVAAKLANAWGLYDMSGNVSEWTEDCWNENYNGAPSTGGAWITGGCTSRLIRGASWFNNKNQLKSANRGVYPRDHKDDNLGFRVTMVP